MTEINKETDIKVSIEKDKEEPTISKKLKVCFVGNETPATNVQTTYTILKTYFFRTSFIPVLHMHIKKTIWRNVF